MIDLPFCTQRHQQKGSALDPAPVAARWLHTSGRLSRRAAVRHLSGVLAVLATARDSHRTLAQVATPQPPVKWFALVGHTSDPDTLIAIAWILGKTDVVAFLCDGDEVAVWYAGQNTGPRTTLEGGDGGSLSILVTFSAFGGTATLADGRRLTYDVGTARGMAGLYDVTLNGDEMLGTGTAGQRLRGRLVETLPDGRGHLAGTIELVDGSLRDFAAVISAGAEGEFQLVASDDGLIKGAAKPDQGTGWVNVSTLGSGQMSKSGGIA